MVSRAPLNSQATPGCTHTRALVPSCTRARARARQGLLAAVLIACLAALTGCGSVLASYAASAPAAAHHGHRAAPLTTSERQFAAIGKRTCGHAEGYRICRRSMVRQARQRARAIAKGQPHWDWAGTGRYAHVCLTSDFIPGGTNGAAIQGNPEQLGHPVIPGHLYKMPRVYVENNGSGTESAELRIQNDEPFCGHVLPPSWISGTLMPVSLQPGQHAWIPLWVRVPAGTKPGVYHSLVVNFEGAPIVPGVVNNEAAAGCDIIVTVQ